MSNKKLPWILVLASMMLLTLFVSYWLINNYNEQKKQLREDIRTQLQLAYTEVKDSSITDRLTYFFQTSDQDSLGMAGDSVKIQITDFKVSGDDSDGQLRFPELLKKSTDYKDLTITEKNLSDDTTHDHNNNNHTHTNNVHVEKGLVRDIFVEVVDLQDTASYSLTQDKGITKWLKNDNKERFKFPKLNELNKNDMNADHILNNVFRISTSRNEKTYALFTEKLIENNLPSEYSIITKKDTIQNGMRVEYTSNNFGMVKWIVDVNRVKPFLLKRMIPVILFSLFLLGIVGLAFWTLMYNFNRQQQLVKVKSEFINNMTHELKTPLATMSVALEAISGFDLSKDADRTKEYVDISRHEVSRLSLLVDKVLNIAVFDREDSNIKMGTIKMNEIVDEILSSMRLQFDSKNAEVNFHNATSNPAIKGDTVHLTNVIYNIVDNALKYSSSEPKVDIHMTEENGKLKISIQDNGIGISKEYQEKVFDRFFRVPTNDQHDVKGHGLGLSYVKDVITRHDGEITVSSQENSGTTFTITLPKL